MIFVSDLDNTLIFSYKHYDRGICVETMAGKNLSYMTPTAREMLAMVAAKMVLVPVTTRSLAQYQRIQLLPDWQPDYALAANGAVLLRKGQVDTAWSAETQALLQDSRPALEKAVALLADRPELTLAVRLVDEAFVYCKSGRVNQTVSYLEEQLFDEPVVIDTNGEKLYVLPAQLTKGAAVQRLRQLLPEERPLVAAGDSYFDLSMLKLADTAIVPPINDLLDKLQGHRHLVISPWQDQRFSEITLRKVLTIAGRVIDVDLDDVKRK